MTLQDMKDGDKEEGQQAQRNEKGRRDSYRADRSRLRNRIVKILQKSLSSLKVVNKETSYQLLLSYSQ